MKWYKQQFFRWGCCSRIAIRIQDFSYNLRAHYSDVIMGPMAFQITSLTIVYSTVYSGADQRKHQSSVSLAFVRGIHMWPVNCAHKWLATRKIFCIWWRHHEVCASVSTIMEKRINGYWWQFQKRSHMISEIIAWVSRVALLDGFTFGYTDSRSSN